MRLRSILWLLVSVACFIGAFCFWRLGNEWKAKKAKVPSAAPADASAEPTAVSRPFTILDFASTAPIQLFAKTESTNSIALSRAEVQLKYRVSNTTKTAGLLTRDDQAILLANALIDLRQPLNLDIPDSLKSQDDPGAYIVQSRGPISDQFRAQLSGAGASIISYIPNNAFLVRASSAAANQLRGSGFVQAVLPFEPYYKVDARLLDFVLSNEPKPAPGAVNVVVYPDALDSTREALIQMGGTVIAQSSTPFGVQLTVRDLLDIPAVASLPGVGNLEAFTARQPAADLARVRVGVAFSATNAENYLGLSGSNVIVNVNDTGVDGNHPDLTGRVFGPAGTNDTDGHGTHVAGIIAGNGTESLSVSNASGSLLPPVAGQFRGMAPLADIFAFPINDIYSDMDLQEEAARTNALISNNSWAYQDTAYDIASASYDAAVRDSLSGITGSQPVLYVFAAGNEGAGDDIGLGGRAQSILSPATAKNVITVGAVEQPRNITNEVIIRNQTNAFWEGETDSDNHIAAFSSRGNVGIGVEGDFGRFKPDVVAPGVFMVSTRSGDWNEAAYYNPTSSIVTTEIGQVVDTNSLQFGAVFIPENAVQLIIRVENTIPHVEEMPIYVRDDGFPSDGDFAGFNEISIPPDRALTKPIELYYAVGNPTNVPVRYDLTTILVLTNELGNYHQVFSNMNEQLGPNYRYESSTSMAAPVVSGMAALIADFFTNRVGILPSPALMKAMLINGARPVHNIYDLDVRKDAGDNRNYQGWGIVNLTNSVPSGWQTNDATAILTQLSEGPSPMLIFDQTATNALGTADQSTWNVAIAPNASNEIFRVTLVWTDPPGNPAAGIKLVNDLDLVVTNLETKAVYFGNDIQPGANFTFEWDTNSMPRIDSINNVESILIPDPLGTNYSITVIGRAVNVNAVTGHTNKVAQDFALVISAGNGSISNALTVTPPVAASSFAYTNITYMTNQFGTNTPGVTGQLLLNQHVGANSPLIGNNNTVNLGGGTSWGPYGTNGTIYLGQTNQWHFYALTNSESFTNAAFVTFITPTLALPRMGVTNYDNQLESTRIEADLDMYVSQDAGLLALDPNVIASASKALTRGGTEVVGLTNANPGVYYVGIHSPDNQAAEFGFFGGFSELPFSEDDGTGVTMRGINVPQEIPDGTPAKPGVARILAICMSPVDVRRVVVQELSITHENLGDLVGNLSHNQKFTVLHNHRPGDGTVLFQYEDNEEDNPASAQRTDGPGSLRDFVGERGEGLWLLTEIDDALGATGRVNSLRIRLDRAFDADGIVDLDVQPNSFAYTYVDVPPEGTNLTIIVLSNTLPVELYLRRNEFPSRSAYDHFFEIPTGGATNSIHAESIPPLQIGRYYVGIYNPNTSAQRVRVQMIVEVDVKPVATVDFTMFGPLPVLDDAVTYSSINVPYDRTIARVDVGVALEHPRISDMALTLISPSGKRILLFENRGGETANLGTLTTYTNVLDVFSSGQQAGDTNSIAITNSTGVLVVDFDFDQIPDTLDVYYGNTNIFSSGLVNGSGTLTIPFGPGSETNLVIVVNQNNNPNNPGTVWNYTARVITQNGEYFTFSENTNFAKLPIKFANPPFTGSSSSNSHIVWHSSFEVNSNNTYFAGASIPDGWIVDSGSVDIVTNGTFGVIAVEGLAHLDLNGNGPGAVSVDIPVSAGKNYRLAFAHARNPDSRTIYGTIPIAEVRADGNLVTNIIDDYFNTWGDLDWREASVRFTAASSMVHLSLESQTPSFSGVLFDAMYLTGDSTTAAYYLPEESLEDLRGDNAQGEWKLELWDTRAGAMSPVPQLLSWQLRFIFDREIFSSVPVYHDVPITNTIAPCQTAYYRVDVPSWARFITNTLVSASSPVNVYFNTNEPPDTGGLGLGDLPLFPNPTTGDVRVLTTNDVSTSRYFIAIENPCDATTNATVVFKIEFDITALTNSVPYHGTNDINVPRYFYYDVSTNATAVSFQLTNLSGNFSLVARYGGPLPTTTSFHYGSFNPGTLDEEIDVFTNSVPAPLAPGRWYLGVFNAGLANDTFTIVATEYTNQLSLITLTNAIPYTNSVAVGGEDYYRFVVAPASVRVQFELNDPSGAMALAVSKGLPFASMSDYDYLSDNPSLNDEFIVILPGSTPVTVSPGDWFLTAINLSGGPVDYSVKATQWLSTGRPITITDIDVPPPVGTNVPEFCITWDSLPGIRYHVQGNADLTTTNWVPVSPTITAVANTTTYCVPMTPGNQFFRVVEGLALSSFAAPQEFGAMPIAGGGFRLAWTGSPTEQYEVQWTDVLPPPNPPGWQILASPITSTNGVFMFDDMNTNEVQRFYRVLLLP